ncbi:g4900 [Coccomyxa viridis]|uniref:G4900 protein n=1 Tax=Coccomyxa viridis TaxID=1274662 RepID=A0ABP1FVF7_9CHLO
MATHSSKVAHKVGPHHLSQQSLLRECGASDGWVESLTSLTESVQATQLLDEGASQDNRAPKNGSSIGSASEGDGLEASIMAAITALTDEVNTHSEQLICVGESHGWGPSNLTDEQLATVLLRIRQEMDKNKAEVTILREVPAHLSAKKSSGGAMADILVRKRSSDCPRLEVRVAVIGNVDSGKSTLVGVLTRGLLDDGRGLARSKVFKHGHESATGRTSSIGQHNLCLDAKGGVLNDSLFRTHSCADYIARSSKVVTLVDLAGHERYFKTTAYGLTGHLPDYACLIVGANAGIVGMCKEHLGVALALKVPVFFVVTKVDICPGHVLQHSLATLSSILRKPGIKKKPYMVRSKEDVLTCARHIHTDSLAPVFLTSSVTGDGLELVKLFFNLLPQRHKWADRVDQAVEFIIDETFQVAGVGVVVAGTVKRGTLVQGSTLLLGPHAGDASFKLTGIKSIAYKRLPVAKVVAGQTAALALKKVKRSSLRKGMVLVDSSLHPKASWEFDADIAILTHSTTIAPKYQAVIHCEIVRQAARVVAMDRERLRSGDRACVRFRFLQRPEYLAIGSRFVFREGRTKGIGVVMGV